MAGPFSWKAGNGLINKSLNFLAIWITVWIQGLFSDFVTIGRYRKWLTDTNLLLILIRQMATLVRRVLAEVCTAPVVLVIITFRVRRSRGEMYSGHGHLCVCLSLSLSLVACSHCTDLDVSWECLGVPSSCALLGGFTIGALYSLIWQHTRI